MKTTDEKTLKVFYTGVSQETYLLLQERMKNYNNGNLIFIHVGDAYSNLELMRFGPDIIITNLESYGVYMNENDILKRVA